MDNCGQYVPAIADCLCTEDVEGYAGMVIGAGRERQASHDFSAGETLAAVIRRGLRGSFHACLLCVYLLAFFLFMKVV